LKELKGSKEEVKANVNFNHFELAKIDPFHLGYLIALWEYRTFITAKILQINPFDQFGVEAGKKLTEKL
jgi:glucose-6-phosphate isomerase